MSEGKRNSVDGKGSSRHSTSSSVSPLRNRKSGSKQDHENFKSKSSHLSGRRLSTSSHSTSHSDQEEKKNTNTSNPTSQKELKEFHAKTIDRIIHKRREYDAKFLQYTDERRKESNAFRMHWKENLKRQRLEAIISEVDRKIVQTSIPTKNLDQPNTYSYETHLSNILKLRKENEKELHRLTADLDDIDDIIPFEKRKDSGVYTLSLKQRTTSSDNANANKSAPSSRPVSITGGRMRSASIEFNSGRKNSVGSKFLQYICSFDLNVRSKLLEPWSGVSSVKLRFDINSEKDSKKMTNQLQIMELLDDIIVKDPRLTAATSTTPFQPNNNIKFGGSIPIPPTQKRLPKGLMLQVFQEILENYPGSSSLNMGRKISHSISIDDSVTYTKSPLFPNNAAKDAKNENPLLSSLVDGCFLIGPDQSSIIQVMMERGNNSNPVGTALSPEVSSQKEKVPSTQSRHVVTPKVLFRSEFHFPPEMLQLLPSYCFPSDAEVILDTANMTKNRQSLNRKDSINRFDGNATSEIARRTLSAANSKRTRVFFPSNETIRVEDDEVVKENLSSPPIGMIPTRSTLSSVFKAPFIILLGDHTYQQYCLVFQIPVVFFDSEKGFMVQTNYCLCFLTKFAFFTFLTHMIQQIDEELKIFSFKEALPEFDPKFPAALQLRLLNDLTNKLKKIMVPLYPYLVRNDSSLPLSASKVNSEAAKKSSDNHSGASNPSAAGSNNHQSLMNPNPAPTAQVNNEYLAILQDLQFSFHLNVNNGPSYIGSPASPISPSTHSERKQFNFIRTFYQNYYSQYLSPSDVSLDSNLIHLYEKNYQQQGGKLSDQASTLGRNHLSEKDREDSFFILQWALPTLLKYLPLDQIVLALGCAMTEMVILVKHKDLQVVSSVILAMAQLLKPLKWCSPIIITLPDQLQDLIESPVPIILGLQKLPPGFALPERYVVVDPQERIVHLNPFDLVQSQSILLPNGSRLVTALKSCADAILRFSSRAKKARVKPVTISPIRMDKNSPTPALSPFSVNNHSPVKPFDNLGVDHHRASDIHTTIGATSTSLSAAAVKTESTIQEVKDEIKNSSPNPPSYPLELDCKNSDCTSYLGYIKQFVTIVHNHILAILNTAIHLQHVEKQAAKAKRRVVANKPLETLKSKGVDHTTEHVNTERGGNFDKLKTSPNPKTVNEHHLMHTDSLDVGVGSFDQLENLNGKKPPKDPKSANYSPQKLPQSSMPTQKYLSPQKDEKRDIDEYSDVTLTDFPVEENDPSNESFCSSSSSLPSLASDAPLLAVKEIGQNGLKFVKQLADTQMFSNYCQSLKLHSSTTTVDGSIIGANTVVAGAPTGDKQGLSGVESDHHLYQTPHHHDLRFDEAILDEEDNFDSISSLFDILLTGTVPLDAKAIQPYQIIYDSLYSAQPKVNVDLATYEREWFSKISRLLKNRERLARYRKKLIKSIALSSNSYTFSVAANNHPLNYLYESGDNQMGGLADGLIPDLKQCNGLICNGFCNTAICSEICIELWTAKVKKLRHHQAAYEIVSKKYEKKSKAPVYTRVNPSYLESNSDQFQQLKRMTLESSFSSGIVGGSMLPENERTPPKIEYLTKDGPHYEIFRHQRETESQYRQRKEITRESILKKQGSGTAYTSLEGVQHNRSTRSHRSSPREGDAKRKKDKRRRHRANSLPSKTFTVVSFFKVNSINHLPSSAIKASAQLSAIAASSENGAEKKRFSAKDMFLKKRKFIAEDSSSSNFLHTSHDSNHNYLTALAKYYAKREERLVHKYLKRCKRRIQQFLLNFIYTYRRKRFLLAVIIVQAYLRRFHVRLHLEEILDKIHEERQQRFCSKVRIRNFLRYYGDFIMRNRHRKQLLEQRKRLSRVSIPIAAPKDASDATKGKILSANSNLSNMGQPVKYINDPTLPTMPSNTMDTSEKISRSMKDDTVGKARLQQKKELNINTSEVGEAAFVVPNTKKNASLGNGATPQAANTPTYTDRAKEFLQFGKILRRSSLPTPRLLPMRRKSNDFKKPTVGVAIPSTDDHSTSTGELNHDGDAPSAIPLTQINDNLKVTEKRSPASKGEAALSPTADPSLSPTQRALHVDYFQADAVPNRGPPLPARKSLDQAGILNILEHSNSHSNSAKVSRSKSSELERTNSQETADDLSTHSSSLVRSFGNEANQSNSNSDMEPSNSAMSHPQHRNSFFSRGLSSLLTRSRSTDSNQSERLAMKRNTIATASPLSSLNHSPSLALHSSQSYEFDDFGNPMIATGSVKSGSSPASEEREKDKEKKRFSDIFERSDGNTPTLSFPNVFGFSGGNGSDDGKSPSRKGGVSGYDSVEVANKTDSSRSRTQSEELNGKLPPNGGMDGSNHSSQSHSQSVSSKGSSKNGGNYGFVKAVRAAATSFLTTQSDDHEEKALEKNVPEEKRKASLVDEGAEYLNNLIDEDDDGYGHLSDDLASEFDSFPLKSLGPTAMEYINRQQITLIKKMWKHLLQGVPVIKHSRSGKPKNKILFCDYAMTRLYWRSPGSKPDPHLAVVPSIDEDIRRVPSDYLMIHEGPDDVGGRHSEETITHGSDSDLLASSHSHFTLQNSHSNYSLLGLGGAKVGKRKSIFSSHPFQDSFRRSSFTKSDREREITLKEILSITSDGQSDVFRRSAAKNYFQQHEDTSLMTLFLLHRSLDCEIVTDIFAEIFPALQIIVNYFQIYMTGHLSLRSDVQEQLTYVLKNGEHFPQHAYHHHHLNNNNQQQQFIKDGMNEHEDEMNDVLGKYRNQGHPMAPPPNTPNIANNYQYPNRYMTSGTNSNINVIGNVQGHQHRNNDDGHHRNSLKHLFPIAENQEEEK